MAKQGKEFIRDVILIGGSTYDITGVATGEAILYDSNPSCIYSGCGGAGRNIAENMARMGMSTDIISAFGTDVFSKALMESCRAVGMDTTHCYIEPGASSCKYVSLLDKSGELLLAAADLELLERFPIQTLEHIQSYIDSHSIVFVDTNLTVDMLERIAALTRRPLFGDTVSIAKAPRFTTILPKMDTVKTNLKELSALSGREISSRDQLVAAANALLERGVGRVFVTMGADGACCVDDTGAVFIPSFPTTIRNVTGAGDAFGAGIAYASRAGMENADILALATAASQIALESPYAVSADMTEERLLQRYRTIKNLLD